MIEIPALAAQLAPNLLPYLPALLKGAKQAADTIGQKLSQIDWDTALKIWDRLRPQVEKQPEIKKNLDKAAEKQEAKDPRAEALLSLQLEDILAALPPQEVNEIHNIFSQSISQTTTQTITVTASGERSIAIGGSVSGSTFTTGDQPPQTKPNQ